MKISTSVLPKYKKGLHKNPLSKVEIAKNDRRHNSR